MRIHTDIVQGSPEWMNLRLGKITASEVGAFVLKATTKAAKNARYSLYDKKLAERSGAEMAEPYENYAMVRGKALEPEARRLFEYVNGVSVQEVAFVEHDSGLFGASPDGYYVENGRTIGLELKCPLPETHVGYVMRRESLLEKYRHQVMWQMAITGWDAVALFSYCPRISWADVVVERTEEVDLYADSIGELAEEYKAAIDQYNSIFAEQRARIAELREGAAA